MPAMTTARHTPTAGVRKRPREEIAGWSDLATVNAAIATRLPEMAAGKIGLTEIAELCKRDLYARPARDCGMGTVRVRLALWGFERCTRRRQW
jgi:hypothetical protein